MNHGPNLKEGCFSLTYLADSHTLSPTTYRGIWHLLYQSKVYICLLPYEKSRQTFPLCGKMSFTRRSADGILKEGCSTGESTWVIAQSCIERCVMKGIMPVGINGKLS